MVLEFCGGGDGTGWDLDGLVLQKRGDGMAVGLKWTKRGSMGSGRGDWAPEGGVWLGISRSGEGSAARASGLQDWGMGFRQ